MDERRQERERERGREGERVREIVRFWVVVRLPEELKKNRKKRSVKRRPRSSGSAARARAAVPLSNILCFFVFFLFFLGGGLCNIFKGLRHRRFFGKEERKKRKKKLNYRGQIAQKHLQAALSKKRLGGKVVKPSHWRKIKLVQVVTPKSIPPGALMSTVHLSPCWLPLSLLSLRSTSKRSPAFWHGWSVLTRPFFVRGGCPCSRDFLSASCLPQQALRIGKRSNLS